MKNDLEAILSDLRAMGISKEICETIRRNSKAGALEYAKALLMEDGHECMERVPQ